jgi:hypothetical protein
MLKNEIVQYQFAERIKSALIIGSKMLAVLETLKESELEGAKKTIFAFFDGLSTEIGIAVNATEMQEFDLVDEKITELRRLVKENEYREAQATLGKALSHATTACERTMRRLMEGEL